MDAHRSRDSGGLRWGVEPICRTLEIAPTTYYDAKSRPASARALSDAALIPVLVALFVKNYSVYGRRKLTKAAHRAGLDVGRDQVARLMRAAAIRGASRSSKRFTTRSVPAHTRAPDLLHRDFTATRPDEKWIADYTYCSTWSGIVYVAFVVDVFSRRIVGWKAARTMATGLVLDALNMAAWTRRGGDIDGVICHSELSRARARWRPLSRSVSLTRSPNRTCDFHRIRLSIVSCRRATRPNLSSSPTAQRLLLPDSGSE
ncbi:MAG: IS3 family transposase [Acidimicrobiales bacterium]